MSKYSKNKSSSKNTDNVTIIDADKAHIDSPEFASGDLGLIQKLLFGQQMRTNTEQFSQQNSQIQEQLSKLADTFQQQLTELRTEIDTKIQSLKEAHHERDNEYRVKLTAITNNHAALDTSFSEKLKANSDSSAQVQKQLNDQIVKSSAAFTNTLDNTRNELTNMIETATAELQTQKIDSTALSNLFGTVATQLSNLNQLPDGTSSDNQHQPQQFRTGRVENK